ncbi:MAG: carbon storage regulator [Clostridiales bacterium]|jgi:carbon storage regulator CsrA|nr:carbon storage regulator [Clostridiales bacterium]
MLVITRKINDSIIIELGDGRGNIEIKVLEVGNQIRLGIDAPVGYKVWRNEIYENVLANRMAASPAPLNVLDVVSKLSEKHK